MVVIAIICQVSTMCQVLIRIIFDSHNHLGRWLLVSSETEPQESDNLPSW